MFGVHLLGLAEAHKGFLTTLSKASESIPGEAAADGVSNSFLRAGCRRPKPPSRSRGIAAPISTPCTAPLATTSNHTSPGQGRANVGKDMRCLVNLSRALQVARILEKVATWPRALWGARIRMHSHDKEEMQDTCN